MTVTTQTYRSYLPTKATRFRALRELMIWHQAWQEKNRLLRLDPDALRDLGITEAQRHDVTVAQIAARIRG